MTIRPSRLRRWPRWLRDLYLSIHVRLMGLRYPGDGLDREWMEDAARVDPEPDPEPDPDEIAYDANGDPILWHAAYCRCLNCGHEQTSVWRADCDALECGRCHQMLIVPLP